MTDWIEQYTQWASKRSPLTPRHFHQNIGLTLLAGAVAGRCYVQLPHEPIYPNMYTLIIARTSVFAKSTALNLGRRLASNVMPDKIFSSIGSPESLFDSLSGEMPTNYSDLDKEEKARLQAAKQWGARKLFILDEAGLFFNTLTRDYASNMADHFMSLYDAGGDPIEHTTRSRGMIRIKSQALSVLFATTPYSVKNLLTQRPLWMSGFWVRWNFVSAKEIETWKEAEYSDVPADVRRGLQAINSGWLTKHDAKPASLIIDPQVTKEYMGAMKMVREEIFKTEDERFDGLISRLATKHLKASILYALIDGFQPNPKVTMKHWEQAAPLVNGWYMEARQALDLSYKSEKMTEEDKVIGYIRTSETGITNRRLQQLMHKTAEELSHITEPLYKAGTINQKKEGRTIVWTMKEVKVAAEMDAEAIFGKG